MFFNQIKTLFLLGSLSALLLFMGRLIGGDRGLTVALIMALIMNFITYFFSDKIILRMYGAQPLNRATHAQVYQMVEELANTAKIPMPQLWYLPTTMANAFATGRNPQHASVAVTEGILQLLDPHELRGVLAHELSHIKNRDILVATVAATLATAISYLADMLRWSYIFGERDSENRSRSAGTLVAAILLPIGALLIQMAISRSREYLADESGADCCHDPLALASALEKISDHVQQQKIVPRSNAHTSTASIFFVYPFLSNGFVHLFSTHPPLKKRIERLRKMAR